MESVVHREPHRDVRMGFPFLRVTVSHEVVAEKDVGLDFLQRIISALRRDPDS